MCATSPRAVVVEAELETIWVVYLKDGTRIGTLVGNEYQTIHSQACTLLSKTADEIVVEDSGRKKPKCPNCPSKKSS